MSKRSACNHEQIEQFWEDALPPEQLPALEKHLSVCEQCQGVFDSKCSHYADISTAALWLKELGEKESWLGEQKVESQQETGSNATIRERRTLQSEAIADIAKRMFDRSENPSLLGTLDEYDVVEPLGAGGMGIVFKGYDRELQRFVAIKLLAPSVSLIGSAKQRFVREAQSAASIVSPFVVPIHAVASHGEIPYLVMSYVPGINLQELIEESGALTPLQTVRIARQVALGLAAAHERGLIHRDIKPGNILIERNGQRAVLTDFGLAQAADDASLTHSGLLAGTPNFMSPEQANGIEIDARSDLFSLGSVMYAMLAGHPPFRAPNAYAVVKRLIEESPRSLSTVQPTTPDWLARLVMRLLEKDRDQRFASAVEVAELLVECEKHLEHPSLHPLPRGLAIKSTASRFAIATGLAFALGCIGLLVAWSYVWRLNHEQPREFETAQTVQQRSEIADESDSARNEQSESRDKSLAIRWPDEDATWSSLQAIENAIHRLELDNR
jgi:eukaryotic-like serine/threonine-protein kinase